MFNCHESVSQVVDDALKSVTEAKGKAKGKAKRTSSKETDEKLKMAIDALSDYEKRYRFKMIVAETIAEAEAKDESSTIWKKAKKRLSVRERLQ